MGAFGFRSDKDNGGSYVNPDGSIVTMPGAAGAVQTLGGWFDVKNSGAKGDGSTDDTSAINAAIDACAAAGGGTVFFPKGRYKVTAKLHDIPKQSRLLGAGNGGYGATASVIESYTPIPVTFNSGAFGGRYAAIEKLTFLNKSDTYSSFLQASKSITLVESAGGGMMKFTTSTSHGYSNGDQVTIASVTGTGGLPAAANKTWRRVRTSWTILTSSNSSGTVKIKTDRGHRLKTGESVTIASHSISGYNGTWTVTVPASKTITNAANNGSGVWRITATGHGYSTGDQVEIRGVFTSSATYWLVNGTWTITVHDADSFDLDGSTFVGGATYVSGGVVMPTTFTLDSSTYTSSGTGGTMSQASKFTVDDDMSFNSQAGGNLQNADFVGAYTSGGTAKKFDSTLFDANVGCAIEMMNCGFCRLSHVSIVDYPVGIAYDGAEQCELEFVHIGGDAFTYSDFLNTSIGVWITDGTHRGRSGVDGATNTMAIRNMQCGGAYNFRFDCGDFCRLEHCNIEGGRKGFDMKGGVQQLLVSHPTSETVEEELVHFQSACFSVRFEYGLLASRFTGSPVFRVDAGVAYFQLLGNSMGTVAYSYAIKNGNNLTDVISLGNTNSNTGGLLYDSDPLGNSIIADHDTNNVRVGMGINVANATALVHGRLQSYSYPLQKFVDSLGQRYEYRAVSNAKQWAKHGLYSTQSGNNGSGPIGATERYTLSSGGGTQDVSSYTPPGTTYAVGKVFWEVIAMTNSDPTKYGRWLRSQWVRVSAGTVTAIGSPVDEQTAEDTDGGYAANPPTLQVSGGDVVIRIHQHATSVSHWIVRTDCTWVEQ